MRGSGFHVYLVPFFTIDKRLDSLGCCNRFQTLAWNILDEIAAILVGFVWHGILILFLFHFHMCEYFVPFMIHFTLIMFDFQGVISRICLLYSVLGKSS